MESPSGGMPGDVRRAVAWMAAGLIVLVPALGHAGEAGAPAGPSLVSIDREAFRSHYGQEAPFRLRLGVDAADPGGNPESHRGALSLPLLERLASAAAL